MALRVTDMVRRKIYHRKVGVEGNSGRRKK